MSKKQILFEEASDEEVSFTTRNEYAKKYDSWREKEEIHKLEQKYGPKPSLSDASASSDSEDESDEPPEVSEETEAQFLKTLALLKTKDPRIYDSNYQFFNVKEEKEQEKKPKAKTLTFDDSDDDDDDDDGNIFTVEKKAEIVNIEKQDAKPTESAASRKTPKEGKLKEYLTGKAEHMDEDVEQDLAPLKALWSDPKLNEGEAFLRDYILNKQYLDDGDLGEAEDRLRDDEDLEEDEKMVEEQGKFERAYNFRFEEPDEEYLKRFPRTMNYIRPKDDRRSRKRAEVRTRKEEEKRRKMEEISRLKALKLKEIQEKIARIKEVTGNEDLAFKDDDIEGDFDPEEHDRRMKAIFDEQFYGEVDDQKPVFPDLDEELEIENWDKYDPERDRHAPEMNKDGPHCEDDDFNMDADFDPKQARTNLMEEIKRNLGKKRRNRKKKSKLAELLATEKPKFIPTIADKSYKEYMEEYYKMDCEDVIGGDLPTRFKYREVVPNGFGLTVEEILLADDKELTQWVPLKKIVKHRPADVEKGEVNTYAQKAADLALKRKVLPSLFKDLPEEPEIVVPVEEAIKKSKKKKKKSKDKKTEDAEKSVENTEFEQNEVGNVQTTVDDAIDRLNAEADSSENISKRKKKQQLGKEQENKAFNEGVESVNIISKKNKRKHKKIEESETNTGLNDVQIAVTSNKEENETEKELNKINLDVNMEENTETIGEGKSKKNKQKIDGFIVESVPNVEPSQDGFLKGKNLQNNNTKRKLVSINDQVPKKKKIKNANMLKNLSQNKKTFRNKFNQNNKFKTKQSNDQSSDNPLGRLSDERLKAYGLNPKKYRSFLKYKKF